MAKNEQLEGIKKTEQYLTNLFKARFSFIYIPHILSTISQNCM